MNDKNTVDLDTPRLFFDPHPGFAGAMIPIPPEIKRVADEMSGQTLPLREAIARLQQPRIGDIEIIADHGYIGLRLRELGREHFFRVIRYR